MVKITPEERRAAGSQFGASSCNQALEGHVLVRVGPQADLADALEESCGTSASSGSRRRGGRAR